MTVQQERTSSQLPLHTASTNTSTHVLGSRSPVWWYGRSRLEKLLLLLALFAVVACVVLAVVLAAITVNYAAEHRGESSSDSEASTLLHNHKGDSSRSGICFAPACIKTAAEMLSNMDTSADPCDDFYQFACGTYDQTTVIPEDKTSINMFTLLDDRMKANLKSLIEKEKLSSDLESFWKLKDLYAACINTTLIDEVGDRPLKDLLSRVGGWPVVLGPGWDEASFDWVETNYKFRDEGVSIDYLFDLSIGKDLKNTSYRLVELDQPEFGMPDRAFLLKGPADSLVRAYFSLMVNAAVLLGAPSREAAESELMESLKFEIALANLSLPREERRNYTKLYNKMTVGDLYQITSQLDWMKYLNRVLSPHEIKRTEPVVVGVPEYLKKALDLVAATPKRVVANYMMWRSTFANIGHLGKKYRAIRLEYVTKLSGQTQETARWLQCMGVVSSGLPNALGSMYVRKYFQHDAKAVAVEMVANIRRSFEKILAEVDWMDSVTLEKARQKLASISQHIAYPDELLDNRLVDDLYRNLTVDSKQHFSNVMSIRRFAINYAFSQLRKPVNKSDWIQHGDAAEVNAFYNPPDNSIMFPAGILQGGFFGSARPRYLNYGAIGFVIGHEITHGFDDQGRQFDKEGNLQSWWEEATDDLFRNKTQCIIDQYSEYVVPENGMRVNGINTQGENIADNGGLKEAYMAYGEWSRENKPEPVLPGLNNFTQTQLFWLSAANVWCSKSRPEALTLKVVTGYHSPSRFRVNGPMSNLPQFSQDFGCKSGTKMNPVAKCSVW